MSLDDVMGQFIVDKDIIKEHLERIVQKALLHCRIDKTGQVLIKNAHLTGKDQVKLTLAARALASQYDSTIDPGVTVAEISKYTGLPADQVRARARDAVAERYAESPAAGVYKAVAVKVEAFLDGLSNAKDPKG